jgi:hypothetical protein
LRSFHVCKHEPNRGPAAGSHTEQCDRSARWHRRTPKL